MKCELCTHEIEPEGPNGIWTSGHNAEPVTGGRCCKECNDNVVIPVRIQAHYGNKGEE